ncbi:MAG: NADH-ubiquinone oxidoreductase-F iron-sulfur binding region domain-containing protein [Candidatus Pacebacteria bacterium]|nr:NADH-ubiquinone oxidoreductase-F iron-sulfur binding region domain-containing protein [Candidatus Paceibacterota bacterium]
METDIISKLKEANLLGRGGAGFPAALKWELVKKAEGEKKYIICNASEGEPNVFKDRFILEHYPQEVLNGIDLAFEAIGAATAYIYLKHEYFQKYGGRLKKLIGNKPIVLFEKPQGYIAGEETVICNLIEGRRMEPRQRPPFISDKGLFQCPTLMNNVETFYFASKINKGEYKNTRFYSVNGEVKKPGVYELPLQATIEQVLNETNNYPQFDFLAQVGGGAVGEILSKDELGKPAGGAGSITIYNLNKIDCYKLMENWADFLLNGNCDKCVPCREGIYRIKEMAAKKKLNKEDIDLIFNDLEKASFCALGRGAPTAFRGLISKMEKIQNGK